MDRSDHHDGVTLRVHLAEQAADELVRVPERLPQQLRTLGRCGELAVRVLSYEVGRLDEHDRARLPHVAKGAEHRLVVVSQTEGRLRVRDEQLRADRAGGHLSVGPHEAGDRLAPVVPAGEFFGVQAVAVRDHRPRPVRARELVPERADLGVEELLLVLVHDAGDSQVDEAAAGAPARPPLEHLAGGCVAERLADLETFAVSVHVGADRARARAQGHVAVGQLRLPVDRPGGETADRGPVEQPRQVRQRVDAGFDVLPRHAGERDDQGASRLRLGGAGGRGMRGRGNQQWCRQHRDACNRGDALHASTSALSGSRSGTSGSTIRRRSTRPPVTRTPRRYSAPPTSTITVHSAALATRPEGSSTEATHHPAPPTTTDRATARGSARGTIAWPVRRDRPTPSTTAPTVYAIVWPTPSAATRAAPSVNHTPTPIATPPPTPVASATTAGVRLSPSA